MALNKRQVDVALGRAANEVSLLLAFWMIQAAAHRLDVHEVQQRPQEPQAQDRRLQRLRVRRGAAGAQQLVVHPPRLLRAAEGLRGLQHALSTLP